MAAIDEKMAALDFSIPTSKSTEQVMQLVTDAAAVSGAGGPKITLTHPAENRVAGVIKNFVRVTMGEFSVELRPQSDSRTQVLFSINDYLRTQSTVMGFIPVSPWGAPGYRTLEAFSQYLRGKL